MKLHVGSSRARGKYRGDEWVNLDIKKFDDLNVIGNGLALPFKNDSFDEIHCVHVLEHLTRDKPPVMLKEMHRVLQPGGVVFIEVPDFMGTIMYLADAFQKKYLDGIHVWTTSVYGKSEVPGMSHHWGFYEGSLRRMLRDQRFKNIERLGSKDQMISTHYRQEPILLGKGVK